MQSNCRREARDSESTCVEIQQVGRYAYTYIDIQQQLKKIVK